ncbi:MAG: hypothetical protein H7Y11_10580, partial [Armatimonadetes bacterium]|nr:hypothetical protein [Anaerolineae bacterium]
MEPTIKRPGILTGLLLGGLLTAPVIALFFLGDVLAGLPLPPLNIIDWMARNLPGDLLTAGIDAMVSVIRGLNLGRTDVYAKLGEQSMGIVILLVAGIVASGVLFALLGRLTQKQLPLLLGVLAGLVIGTILAFMHISLPEVVAAPSPDSPAQIVRVAWILGVMGLWGLALGWVYTDLAGLNAVSVPSQNSVQQLDRRQFLVRVGGATATLTVLGAGLSLAMQPAETEGEAVARIDSSGATVTAEPAPVNVNATLEPAPGTRPEYTPIEDH